MRYEVKRRRTESWEIEADNLDEAYSKALAEGPPREWGARKVEGGVEVRVKDD